MGAPRKKPVVDTSPRLLLAAILRQRFHPNLGRNPIYFKKRAYACAMGVVQVWHRNEKMPHRRLSSAREVLNQFTVDVRVDDRGIYIHENVAADQPLWSYPNAKT